MLGLSHSYAQDWDENMKLKFKFIVGMVFGVLLVGPTIALEATPIATGFIPVNGGKLYYEQFGTQTNNSIIVLHGGPGLDSSYLLPQMAALADNKQVVFYDQRGAGKSLGFDLDKSSINMDTFVSDLETVRQQLGYHKVVLVGHSWGALLGMCYALAHPENISGLILVSGAPSTSAGFQLFLNEYYKRTKDVQTALTRIEQTKQFIVGDPLTVEDYFRQVFAYYFYVPAQVADLTLVFTPESAVNGRKIGEIFGSTYLNKYDLTPKLKKLKIPVLVLHGEEDIVPLQTAINTHKAIPGSQMITIQQCDHFPYIEKPAEFFAAVNDFIVKLN